MLHSGVDHVVVAKTAAALARLAVEAMLPSTFGATNFPAATHSEAFCGGAVRFHLGHLNFTAFP